MEEAFIKTDSQEVVVEVVDLGDAVDETRQTIFLPLVIDNMLGLGLPA
jgi:hypothetical protein